ncbi:diaminopimelate epimerase [Jatrophihabitans sp. DSM 45814]
MSSTLHAIKGHGTENDFVILPDLDAVVSLSPALVRALCDRRAGIGGDGVLRVVRTANATEPDVRAQAEKAEFFMDYHNADGSIAEMCGNGVRVFARYLQLAGLISGDTEIATRGGVKTVHFAARVDDAAAEGTEVGRPDGDSDISVAIGFAKFRVERPRVEADGLRGQYPSVAIDMPNPHVVVELPDQQTLADLQLFRPPLVQPALPEGQNVEFVVRTGRRQLAMRVHERGVGETRSCGTGICAAVVAIAGETAGEGEWFVDTPGGRCRVSWTVAGEIVLSGPAVLVADIEVEEQWLSAHR